MLPGAHLQVHMSDGKDLIKHLGFPLRGVSVRQHGYTPLYHQTCFTFQVWKFYLHFYSIHTHLLLFSFFFNK